MNVKENFHWSRSVDVAVADSKVQSSNRGNILQSNWRTTSLSNQNYYQYS